METHEQLLKVFGRNIDVASYKKGWSPQVLASRLGISVTALNRVRFGRSRYIDPKLLVGLTEVFGCTANDLLYPQAEIDYHTHG